MKPRRFRCSACGSHPPVGGTVPITGVRVLRKRRRRIEPSRPGDSAWAVVDVVASARYPARVCHACAAVFSRAAERAV